VRLLLKQLSRLFAHSARPTPTKPKRDFEPTTSRTRAPSTNHLHDCLPLLPRYSSLPVIDEPLVTMDASADDQSVGEAANITVPVGLVTKATGDIFEPILTAGTTILVTLNWTDVLPHPDSRVEWELWTNSGDNCGAKCDAQKGFIKDFKETAVTLEKNGYTQFTPHYVTWLCPPEAIDEPFCVQQCINNGRYCCPDPDSDFAAGFSGADVVTENLRTLCVFREANATASPWKWWDYVTQVRVFHFPNPHAVRPRYG
jgi:hypothetical protein